MEKLELLKMSIQQQKPICFEYTALGHAVGKRYGNPHAVFIHPTTNNVNIDIFKTGGVSTLPLKKPLPDWKQYRVEHICNVTILEGESSFSIANGYNPNSKQYARVIVKI